MRRGPAVRTPTLSDLPGLWGTIRPVRLRALVLAPATLVACAGCVPSSDNALAFDGVVAAILLQTQVSDGRVLVAREVPYPPAESLVVATATHAQVRTSLLGYPQPLIDYGIRPDSTGAIELDPRGVPLPPPRAWADLHPDEPATAVEPALHSVGDAFPQVRVPRSLCSARLQEVERVPIPEDFLVRLTMALPFGEGRMLLAVVDDDGDQLEELPQLVVATATSITPLPIVFAGEARGFLDPRDGSAWVFVPDYQYGEGGPGLCHLSPTRTASTSDCTPQPGAPFSAIRLAGQRRPGTDQLEMVALGWDQALYHWLGDADDRGAWRKLYTGGRGEDVSCLVGVETNELLLDGPGTGVASFETGPLERFVIADDSAAVERTPLFTLSGESLTSCRSAYGQLPNGGALFVRMIEQLSDFPKPPQVWWRSPVDGRWTRLEDPDGMVIAMGSVTVPRGPGPGDVLVVSGLGQAATVVQLDPRRPDLPPRFCAVQPVYNDSRVSEALPDGSFVLSGGFSRIITLLQAVARWEIVRD